MRIPENYLKKIEARGKKKQTPVNERQELIEKFVKAINLARRGSSYPPVSWREINGLLARRSVADLYRFFGECSEGAHFSKKFFWLLREGRPRARLNQNSAPPRATPSPLPPVAPPF